MRLGISILLGSTLLAAQAALAAPAPTFTATFDAGGLDLAEGLALAPDGSAILVGTAQRGEGRDMIIAKLGPDGETVWAKAIDRSPDDLGADAATDEAGNVYAAGTITSEGAPSVLLVKYDAGGEALWAKTFDKGTAETARALAIDPQGNLLLAGVSMSMNGGDCFVAKFAPDGREIWSAPVNLYWMDECFDVAADEQGNVVAVGRVVRDSNFDVLVRKFSPGGEVLWTQVLSTPAREEGRGVAIAQDGSIFVTGTVSTQVAQRAQGDLMVAKLDAAGKHLWTRAIDLAGDDDEGRGATADAAGGVYLTGFGIVEGEKQSVVVKLTRAGDEVWRHVPGRPGIDGTGSVAVTRDGSRIAIAGALQEKGSDFDFLLVSYSPGRPSAVFHVAQSGSLRAGVPVAFSDASVAGEKRIVSRHWDFGEGSTSEEANPTHTFSRAGTYTVALVVEDEWRTAHRAEQTLLVAAALVPTPNAPPEGVSPEESRTPGPALLLALVAVAVAARLVGGRR